MSVNAATGQNRATLQRIAHRMMLEKGLVPDLPPQALAELNGIHAPAAQSDDSIRDLRNLLWCSIDNDDSRDLDQLTVAEQLPDGVVRILVAIADVDAIVKKHSAIDQHAMQNTTSVYTVAETFPMLPEKLSTDLTSLNFECDRLAVVVEMDVDADGRLKRSDIYRATVRNRAKLAYNSVASWLDGHSPIPPAIGAVAGLDANIRLQDEVAQQLKAVRHAYGALDLETIQTRPVFVGDELTDLEMDRQNRAKELIADFMISANGVVARFLAAHNFPSIRRVVTKPKRWDRIVELAAEWGTMLPSLPSSSALEDFLVKSQANDPLRFPDLSLSVIKLLGPGEYVAQAAGDRSGGHFGLAVGDYAHSTAPNRRYPDVITQRLLKAALQKGALPYDDSELKTLATHCTEAEDAAKKVERAVRKSAAALLLESRIGQTFDAIVTGHAKKGTWVRIVHPPVEGRLITGYEGVDVGRRLRVQLVRTDVDQGFIDFKRQR
ncbi:MAG: RNB domain-containing ribonuclease [Schlesneria sp.]